LPKLQVNGKSNGRQTKAPQYRGKKPKEKGRMAAELAGRSEENIFQYCGKCSLLACKIGLVPRKQRIRNEKRRKEANEKKRQIYGGCALGVHNRRGRGKTVNNGPALAEGTVGDNFNKFSRIKGSAHDTIATGWG